MQSKLSSFFKPSSSSSSTCTKSPIFNEGDDDLIVWQNTQHQFFNTYKRKTPNLHNGEKKIEGNEEQVATKKPNSKDACLKHKQHQQESLSYGKVINKKRSYAQFHLDLGQSDFNLRACSVCGVKYAPGEDEDEKQHKIFHKNYTCGLLFKGFQNERVVHMPCGGGTRIVLVLDCDPPAQRNKVLEVIKMMEIELGDEWIFQKSCKVYLFISSQRVAGCLVAEPIKEAFKVLPSSVGGRSAASTAATKKDSKLNSTTLRFGEIILQREITKKAPSINSFEVLDGDHNGAIICEKEAVPAVCGIRSIWVTPSNRRKRIASQLIDAVRRSFCIGITLENSQLAFSPPTAAGKALALSYTGSSSFLVYRPKSC